MEETEYEFLRSLGLDVIFSDEKGSLGFPRVEAKSRFFSPARYGHILDIKLTVIVVVKETEGVVRAEIVAFVVRGVDLTGGIVAADYAKNAVAVLVNAAPKFVDAGFRVDIAVSVIAVTVATTVTVTIIVEW